MTRKRKYLIAGVAVIALGAGGAGIAQAVGGDSSDEQVTGPEADRAKQAAVEIVGSGRAVGAEREDDDGSAWEVEVVRGDGRNVEVELNRALERVAVDVDDDAGGEDKNEKPDSEKDDD